MDDFQLVATAMRAVRLYAFLLSMGIMSSYGPSLWRLLTGRAPEHAFVRPEAPVSVALERERTRAIWALLAAGVFLIQFRWLTPWLPAVQLMRVWLVGISIVDAVLLAGIFHHGSADPRFRPRRAALAWGFIFALCVAFAVTSR